MHPLLHSRAILLAAMKELVELAQFYGDTYDRTKSPLAMQHHKYFTFEAARLSQRLLLVQIEIEEQDLD